MNCSFAKIFAALMFVAVAFAFSPLADSSGFAPFGYNQAEPLARVFQILFILFIVSPPLMVVMLYLIWKELKARNKMK